MVVYDIILVIEKQDSCEFKASLGYIMSFESACAKNTIFKN